MIIMKYKGYEFKYELTNLDKKFVDYLIKNGFKILECKQYNSKTKFKLEQNGVKFDYETYGITSSMKNFIAIFERSFDTYKRYLELKNK